MGEGFALLLSELRTEAAADAGAAAAALGSACDTLEAALAKVLSMTAGDPEFPYRAAGDFLQLCATVLQAFAWARSALHPGVASGGGAAPGKAGKRWVLPRLPAARPRPAGGGHRRGRHAVAIHCRIVLKPTCEVVMNTGCGWRAEGR